MGIGAFCDIVYAYSVNSPDSRNDLRSGMLGYIFDFVEPENEAKEDMTFDGFKKSALNPSLLDELDAFNK